MEAPFKVYDALMEAAEAEIKQWPVKSNRASALGCPCIRQLVYWRTNWKDAKLHGPELQILFDQGNRIEEMALGWLKKAGFTITEAQRAFEWREFNITGHIDAKIAKDGSDHFPLEIKGLSPTNFSKINTWEDLFSEKLPVYMRKYGTQVICYMLMDGKEWGLFYPVNKITGLPKKEEIWIPLNDFVLDYAEKNILQKAKTINKHVEDGTLPERIEYSEEICGDCPFLALCNPDMQFSGAEIINDSELEALLRKRDQLQPLTKEFDEIDARIKDMVKGKPQIVISDWIITSKEYERTGYKIPDDVKRQYIEKSVSVRTTIQRLKKD